MWYEILITGYSWFINTLDIKAKNEIELADKVGGELTKNLSLTNAEFSQINRQKYDYINFGHNKAIAHLNRTGIYEIK